MYGFSDLHILAALRAVVPRLCQPGLVLIACLGGCSIHPEAPGIQPDERITLGAGVPVYGNLYLPAGASPYPLIIDLHGCSGIMPARDRLWFPRFVDSGFAVLQLDSFTGRGVSNICDDLFKVPPVARSMDVASAIRWTARDARFDPDGIFLTGMSHGGTSSLLTQLHTDSVFSRLRGIVAFYPYCYDKIPVLNSDLLILIGEDDDWTPASRCRDMRVEDYAGHSYKLRVYPGAYHSFDVPGLDEIYLGHRVLYNESAARDSIERVIEFIKVRTPTVRRED